MRRAMVTTVFMFLACGVWAAPVSPNAPDGVVSRCVYPQAMYALDASGQTWIHVAHESGWTKGGAGLPVPLNQIVDWYGWYLITSDGTTWRCPNVNLDAQAQWFVVEPIPMPVATRQSNTLGGVKGLFR